MTDIELEPEFLSIVIDTSRDEVEPERKPLASALSVLQRPPGERDGLPPGVAPPGLELLPPWEGEHGTVGRAVVDESRLAVEEQGELPVSVYVLPTDIGGACVAPVVRHRATGFCALALGPDRVIWAVDVVNERALVYGLAADEVSTVGLRLADGTTIVDARNNAFVAVILARQLVGLTGIEIAYADGATRELELDAQERRQIVGSSEPLHGPPAEVRPSIEVDPSGETPWVSYGFVADDGEGFEQPSRPLAEELAVFSRERAEADAVPRLEQALPAAFPTGAQLDPGVLLPETSRLVSAGVGTLAADVYAVATSTGWACQVMLTSGPPQPICTPGLGPDGVTFVVEGTTKRLVIRGLAANDVTAVAVEMGGFEEPAVVVDNAFVYTRAPVEEALAGLGAVIVTRADGTRTRTALHSLPVPPPSPQQAPPAPIPLPPPAESQPGESQPFEPVASAPIPASPPAPQPPPAPLVSETVG